MTTEWNGPEALPYPSNLNDAGCVRTVGVSATGPQAANITGVIDHTGLFKLLDRALSPSPAGNPR